MEITMETIIDLKFKGAVDRRVLKDMYQEEVYGTEEDFLNLIASWIIAGRAVVFDGIKSVEQKMAESIASELGAVATGKAIEKDREDKLNYGAESRGVYTKVGFPAKTILDAQEMQQQILKNHSIPEDNISIEMKGKKILVTIVSCPIKTYASIERAFSFKRATESVSNVVEKTANGAVNVADMTITNLAVPVAKTAISTGTKVAKSLFGFGAKLAGITIGEVTKATKQCVTEIRNDGYIAEAKGEVIDGVHSVRVALNNTQFGTGGGGVIME